MSLMMQEKLFVLYLDPWVRTFFTWVTEWEVLQLYAQLWWLLISRTRFVWLFELWAKLVTTFTEYHFHWKEQLTNSLCGTGVFGRDFSTREWEGHCRKTTDNTCCQGQPASFHMKIKILENLFSQWTWQLLNR